MTSLLLMRSIQFASGLLGKLDLLKPSAPLLALLGNCLNVSTPRSKRATMRFLKGAGTKWNHIYCVPGLSEYSALGKPTDMMKLRDELQACTSSRFTILDQAEIPFEGGVLLGASGLLGSPTGVQWTTDAKGQRPVKNSDLDAMHEEDIEWIEERLFSWSKRQTKILLATAFSPFEGTPCPPILWRAPSVWLAGANRNISGYISKGVFFASNTIKGPGFLDSYTIRL
jgi:hypothetical protein